VTSLARAADFAMAAPRSRARSLLRGAGTFLLWALAGFAAAIALTLLVPLAFHGRPLTVMSGSMTPTIRTGDVVIAMPIEPLDVRPGDIVSFNDPGRGGALVTHRVRQMRRKGGRVNFITRGDANTGTEHWSIKVNGTLHRTVLRLPKLGRPLVFARTRAGLLTLVLVPLLLLGTLEIASIWKDDDGEVEEGASNADH
jgi:signal peptidase I